LPVDAKVILDKWKKIAKKKHLKECVFC